MGDLSRECSAGKTGKGLEKQDREGKEPHGVWLSSWQVGEKGSGIEEEQEQVVGLGTPQR